MVGTVYSLCSSSNKKSIWFPLLWILLVHYSLIIFSCKHYVVIDIYICILSLITLYRGSLNPCTELNFLLCYAVLTYIFNYFHHKSNSVGCYCYYSGCCHQNNHLNDDFVAAAAAVAVACLLLSFVFSSAQCIDQLVSEPINSFRALFNELVN